MKNIKPFFLLFLIFLIVATIFMLFNRIVSISGIPFVYGLKTKAVPSVSYLAESNTSCLQVNKNTVGIYSIKKDTFALKEIFQISGIPYIFSHELQELNQTKIIFLDFDIDNPQLLTEEKSSFFHRYVKNGGMLIGNEILPTRYGMLKDLFGYKGYTTSNIHHNLYLHHSNYYSYLNEVQEKNYLLSTLGKGPYTNMIQTGTAIPIASYEDNTTAISINYYGKGVAINLGISLYDLRYRNLLAKDFHANKAYINHFEPLSDFIVLFIKGVYKQVYEHYLMLHTSKDGNQATVIMTHDVDFDNSISNIPKFTALEERFGFKATYNIQVKYITDNKDKAFFIPKNFNYLLDAEKHGHEIGSHTILHTKNFFLLPKGDCSESYPEYKPFSFTTFEDRGNPTACGEIKVSKELLLGTGIKNVVTFRSGELLYHPNLPELLEKFGYRYSSCFSAEDVLSYFPYRYMKNYKGLTNPSKIWEIPLVLEDEFLPPMYFRVDRALSLFEKIYHNGGVYTILDHPDLTSYKLKNLDLYFIESFYKQLPKDVWKVPMEEFGNYWDKRDRIIFRYNIQQNKLMLTVHSLKEIKGLTFVLGNIKLKSSKNIKLLGNKLVLDIKRGVNQWVLDLE